MSFHLLHIVRTAERDFAGIAGLAVAMTRHLPIRQSLLFLSGPGPLSAPGVFGAVEPVTVPWNGAKDLGGDIALYRRLKRMKPDLIHQHSGGWPIRAIAKLATAAPIILHLHGRDIEGRRNPKRLVQRTTFADEVIAVSPAVAADSRDPRCKVVPNGIVMPPAPNRHPEARLIVSAGRFVPVRGFDLLIEALALMPNMRLELAGDGPERTSLEALAKSRGVADRIRFLGWLNDLAPVFARGAAYVSPAREDGFGLALAEAMAAAMPVVATDVGGVSWVLGDTGSLVPPGRPAALAEAVVKLLDDPARCAASGPAARRRVGDNFTISHMQAGVTEIYRQCLVRLQGDVPW